MIVAICNNIIKDDAIMTYFNEKIKDIKKHKESEDNKTENSKNKEIEVIEERGNSNNNKINKIQPIEKLKVRKHPILHELMCLATFKNMQNGQQKGKLMPYYSKDY